MTDPPADLYSRAQVIVHALLEQPITERDRLCGEACEQDTDLRREVEWLLESLDDIRDDTQPDDVIARSIRTHTRWMQATALVKPVLDARYRLIERVGEGGMGQVWLAEREQGAVRQRVALKLLNGAGLGTERSLARFHEEGRILGTLNHPNIAHLLEAGKGADGSPFIAMEFVDGQPIDRWCDVHAVSMRERIALFIKVCAAVEYAHAHLVIHRDLKPANILVDESGEAKLLDFGIARLLEPGGEGAHPLTATRVMTLGYASPEQIEGKPLGTATDIYSLGIVLYELIVGVRPFDHLDTDHARSNAIVSGHVQAPGAAVRKTDRGGRIQRAPKRVPADLDAIVMKALRRESSQRYVSVAEFSDDLRAFLASRPVKARRGQTGYRFRRFVVRNRWIITASLFVVVMASAFTWRTVLAERHARAQAAISDQVAEFLVSVFAASDSQVNKAVTHELTAREVLDSGAARIESELADQPRIRARLLEAVGNAYRHMNNNNKGVAMLREAADINLDPAIDQPLDAARSLEAMANAMANGEFPGRDAEAAARESLALAARLTEPGSQQIANAWMVLSLAHNRSGNLVAAENAARTTWSMNKKRLDDPENRFDAAIGNLCIILTHRGSLADAAGFCEASNARRSQQPRHIVQAMSLNRLAQLRSAQGDHHRAINLAEQGLALAEELNGPGSQFATVYRMRLGIMLDEAGRSTDASVVFKRALVDTEKLNGRESGEFLDARFQLARHQSRTGLFAESIDTLRELTPAFSTRYGIDDPRTLIAQTVLAQTLLDSGVADQRVREILDAAWDQWSRKDDPGAVDPAFTRFAIARWFAMNNESSRALELLDHLQAVDSRASQSVKAAAARLREDLENSANQPSASGANR